MAWTNLLNALFLPGKPILGSTGIALRDNLIAALTGDTGAQRLYGQAVARNGNGLLTLAITAADTYGIYDGMGADFTVGNFSTTSTAEVAAETFTMLHYSGSARFKASHQVGGGGWASTLSLYKNGVLVVSYSTTSTAPVARSVDVTFAAGDVIEWRHKTSSSSYASAVSAISVNASNAYTSRTPLIPWSAI